MINTGQASFGLSTQGTLLFAALMICWASGILSAFIDNIPYVAVSIPIVARLTATMQGDTEVLWWALSLGACLGGNGTAIGASANVTTIGLAERGGTRITFLEFSRFGSQVAFLTLVISSLFLTSYVFAGDRISALAGLRHLRARSGDGAPLRPSRLCGAR